MKEDVNIDEDTKNQKLATVPFLLNLASLSQTLLKAITTDVLQTCMYICMYIFDVTKVEYNLSILLQ